MTCYHHSELERHLSNSISVCVKNYDCALLHALVRFAHVLWVF